MKDHFALLPESGGSVTVERLYSSIVLDIDDVGLPLTPAEARQVAAALTRMAALRPVPA